HTPGETARNAVQAVDGGAAGVYGGTRKVASCDVEKQITFLREAPARNRAFASVAGVRPEGVPAYLRSLTPVQLRMDTWVTNHGYRDGAVTTYQAVLQAGTAVLVDAHGLPRVRCACGNPLTKPVLQQKPLERTGDTWPSYSSSNVVVVQPAAKPVKEFVLYDPDNAHHWFARHPGDTRGHQDRPTRPPAKPTPSVTVTTPSASTSPSTPTPSRPSSPGSEPPSSSPSSESPSTPSPPESPSAPPSSAPSPASPESPGSASAPESADTLSGSPPVLSDVPSSPGSPAV
ncbi:DUF6777 domain-containing protein, partial [Streptomyces sp. NPDC002920]